MPKKNILTFQGGLIFRCPHSIKRGQFFRAVFGDVKTIVQRSKQYAYVPPTTKPVARELAPAGARSGPDSNDYIYLIHR
ncbi:hypothetical protein, partial [Pseudomonas thivervalensis]|uniref:hypothetical protein n=1 Tax=Pseudomonas thivervalensis TaxID=86265 RepID=UPI001C0FD85C